MTELPELLGELSFSAAGYLPPVAMPMASDQDMTQWALSGLIKDESPSNTSGEKFQ